MKQIFNSWRFCLLLGLMGCQIGPSYQPPAIDLPKEWHSPSSEGMDLEDPDRLLWWESLNDPLLNSLIQRASERNWDLFIAGTRILEARAERTGKVAELYPHLDASVSTGHLYASKEALVKGILGTTCPTHHGHSVKRQVNFFEIGFDADWEIDLFGVNKHASNALQAKIESAEENLCDVWITLSAEIARNYVELRSLQQRQQLTEKNIETHKETLYLTQQLLTIGMASALDNLQAEEQIYTMTAQHSLLALSIDKAIYRLSILLGEAPGKLYLELIEPQSIPHLPCEKPLGLPSELLRRRPDIRRAERNLAAATESIASAVAALFPRLSLSGFIGDISTCLKTLTSSASGTWFATPQLLLPIFNSRLLTQDINLNKIQAQRALFEYQKIVLLALEEVENGIASFHYELKRNYYLNQAQATHQETHQLTVQLYQRGLKDYLEVLTTTRALLVAEDTVIQSQTDLLLHYISLYKALGGGWDVAQVSQDACCSSEKGQ